MESARPQDLAGAIARFAGAGRAHIRGAEVHEQMQIASRQNDAKDEREDTGVVSAVERGLFKSALDFYGAAGAAIDYRGRERPQLRWEIEALQGVRDAMRALERRIAIACRAGFSTERIVGITRLDLDVVEQIVERQRAGFAD